MSRRNLPLLLLLVVTAGAILSFSIINAKSAIPSNFLRRSRIVIYYHPSPNFFNQFRASTPSVHLKRRLQQRGGEMMAKRRIDETYTTSSKNRKSFTTWSSVLYESAFIRTWNTWNSNRIFKSSSTKSPRIEQSPLFNPAIWSVEKNCQHYTCPPTSLEQLRRLYGSRRSMWGEWDEYETRQFYKTLLPKALQIDGAMNLTLEERAQLASAARHALRIYARERCRLPSRLLANLYDGVRHLCEFGTWSTSGMTWMEVKEKYRRQALEKLGEDAPLEDIEFYIYKQVVEKACSTNKLFDGFADARKPPMHKQQKGYTPGPSTRTEHFQAQSKNS